MELKTALYMAPVGISDAPSDDILPPENIKILSRIRYFIVENVRTARRFLRRLDRDCDIDSMTFHELNGHTDLSEVSAWLDPLRRGEPMAVMSEAGCPGVADPGALVAAIAQREGLRVIPMSGPSSIIMGLMASGFNGQGFAFNGYLPIDEKERIARIRQLETISRKTGMTQIFIETPYRNRKLIKQLSETLAADTLMCVATGITDPENEEIITLPAAKWRNRTYDHEKTPAIFLISRP